MSVRVRFARPACGLPRRPSGSPGECTCRRPILITGCSSGIGAALAREFGRRGHRVYATARRRESLAPLEAEGIVGLALDVDDDGSIASAFDAVTRDVGHLDMLVNNAGFSQVGAVVDLTREDLRRQYETNVIAPVVVTGKALPLLRAAVASNGSAVVANVGSIVGLFSTPFAGAYCSLMEDYTDGPAVVHETHR